MNPRGWTLLGSQRGTVLFEGPEIPHREEVPVIEMSYVKTLEAKIAQADQALELAVYHLKEGVLKTMVRTDGLDMRDTGKVLTELEKALKFIKGQP